MRFILFIFIVFAVNLSFSQTKGLNLRNAMVIAQLDKSEDRFTMEINFTEMLASNGIKAMASLNVLKEGTNISFLASDSIQKIMKTKGIDTYVLVSVRGYDRKFKPAKNHDTLAVEISNGHLFPLYRDEITSISFEFNFYRDGKFIGYDLIKIGGIGSREAVLKKFRKKINKRINSNWK
jgi:hypothetical protein